MANMNIIVRAVDKASDVLEKVKDNGSKAADYLEKNWVKVSAAMAGASVAVEKLARSQAPLTEQTKKLANSVGMTEEEMRNLAISTSNVTFPLNDVLDLFEIGRQQGLKSAEQLQDFANLWDMVGDATGECASALAQSSSALKILGIDVNNQSDALAAFGFVSQETSMSIGDFMGFIERVGPELSDMGMDVNDTAALLGILEREMGLTGRAARQELNSAIQESEGDLEVLMQTLGITQEQFASYKDLVEDSSEVISQNADIHAESYTVMQRLQHGLSELTYKYGDMIHTASNLVPLLSTLTPLTKGLTTAKCLLGKVTFSSVIPALKGAIASTWSFTAALLANPITWVIAGLVALGVAIYALWKNWDTVSEWLMDSWTKVTNFFSNIWEAIKEFFAGLWDSIKEIFSNALAFVWDLFIKYHPIEIIVSIWEEIMDFLSQVWENIKTTAREGALAVYNWVKNTLSDLWNWIKAIPSQAIQWGRDIFNSLWNGIKGIFGTITSGISGFISNSIREPFANLNLFSIGKEILNQLWKGMKSIWGSVSSWFDDKVMGTINKLNPFKRSSPSLVDNIKRGMDVIQREYTSLDLPDFRDELNVDGIDPDEMGNSGVGTTGGSSIIKRFEHLIKFENVPQGIDEYSLAQLVIRALKDPAVMRELDIINYKNLEQSQRPRGGLVDVF